MPTEMGQTFIEIIESKNKLQSLLNNLVQMISETFTLPFISFNNYF